VTRLMLPLSTICSTPASVIFYRIQGVTCVEYAHGPDKRLDRRKTRQISDRMPLPLERRLTLDVSARVARMVGRASNKEGES
jgi:hypothetical protein